MNFPTLFAVACLILWGVLAFVLAVPSGWVHLPLAVGAVLLVRGIVDSGGRAT